MRRAKTIQANKKRMFKDWQKKRGEAKSKGLKLTGVLKDWGGYYSQNKGSIK